MLAMLLVMELRKQSASSVMRGHLWLVFSLAPGVSDPFQWDQAATQIVVSSPYWCRSYSATHVGLCPSC